MFLFTLAILLIVFLGGAPVGLSSFFGHSLAVLLALPFLYKLSKYYWFWLLTLLVVLGAQHLGFSLEYWFFAMAFSAYSLSKTWLNLSQSKRFFLLSALFVLIFSIDYIGLNLYEKGSLGLWLPVMLTVYLDKLSIKSGLAYLISTTVVALANKFTTLIAQMVSATTLLYKSISKTYLAMLALIFTLISFVFGKGLMHFIQKSVLSRLFIWLSCFNGFVDSPILGQGFGTFGINFPVFRSHADVFGAKVQQLVGHGHSLWGHYAFELGLVGLAIFTYVFHLLWQKNPRVFFTLVVVSLFDAVLVSFSQFALAALILVPVFHSSSNLFTKELPAKLQWVTKPLIYLIFLTVMIPSILGHYYYSHKDFDKAIQYDSDHSLYYFMRGAKDMNEDMQSAHADFAKAVDLSPRVSYFHGFYAASALTLQKYDLAKHEIDLALDYDGQDAYWLTLSAFINYSSNPELARKHYQKAIKKKPEIIELLTNPQFASSEVLGSKNSDVRISTFYRRGPKVPMPLPIVETLPF